MKKLFITLLVALMFLGFGNTLLGQIKLSEEIDKLANQYVKKKKNHGLVMGIIRGDETRVRGYGQMSKKDKTSPDGFTVFEIGAITSVFTTSLMQLLADQDLFNTQEPIRLYIKDSQRIPAYYPYKCLEIEIVPDMQDRIGGYKRNVYSCFPDLAARPDCIAFCDLASHTSGLRKSPKGWYYWNPMRKRKFENDFKDFTIEELYQKSQGQKLNLPPGLDYKYSDFGIALLGNVMSEIAKKPFEDLLKREILDPLTMYNTVMKHSAYSSYKLAPGHNRKGKKIHTWNFDAMAPAAGLKSTMNDLIPFVQANLNPPNKEFENAFAEVQQSKSNLLFGKNGRVTSMGYGWFTSNLTRESNEKVTWVNGGTGGYRAFI
jgi:CubicO group peptidase (beta-lactamase class C family)